MRVDLFDYELSPDRVAQRPAKDRESARLLVLGPEGGPPGHRTVADLPDLLPPGALVVVNDTRVLPARLLGYKQGTGGRAEIFLVRKLGVRAVELGSGRKESLEVWGALGRASKGLKEGACIDVGGDLEAHVLSRDGGGLEVALRTKDGSPPIDVVRRVGHVPLPPYIRRDDEQADAERYQTVFARVDGAVAAPTAGLHLTEALLERLSARGQPIASITLHVGLGTFQAVTAEDLDQHPMHEEWFEVPERTVRAVEEARARKAPVVAVGTTVVRALESAGERREGGLVESLSGETKLLIQPGYRFRVVDQLLTNFHLPKSTLLALVCAFGGTERLLAAYRTAHEMDYRFFSYGDAMLVSPARSR